MKLVRRGAPGWCNDEGHTPIKEIHVHQGVALFADVSDANGSFWSVAVTTSGHGLFGPWSREIWTVGPLAMGYAMASRGALGFGTGPWPPGLGRAQILLGSGLGSWPPGLDRAPILRSAPFGCERGETVFFYLQCHARAR